MKNKITLLIICFFTFLLSNFSSFAQKPDIPEVWEKEISAFEKRDMEQMPEPGGIVFTGSSSIRGWRTLKEDYPHKNVINRGFGGSRIGDATYYFDRIVSKYHPKQVVLYSGDNDIASGKTPQMVFEKFKEFARKMGEELPQAELLFISIKPSIARWSMYEQMEEANKKIKEFACQKSNIKFINVATPMLGEDGKPRPELFIGDGLHMTSKGYEIWKKEVSPYLAN